ncbi:hypothetical protein MW887_000734 [Aspergillus wentii]|nr:hypothetical protein MW887_000734 [Aspergillus wentii]
MPSETPSETPTTKVNGHNPTEETNGHGNKHEHESETQHDDDVLKGLGSVEGEELLAFFDNLVAIGSTSCGKSSLLQAITKLPFPVDSGICTRFATETMIHRCKPSERPYYTITIEPKSSTTQFPPREYYGETWNDVFPHLQEDLAAAFAEMNDPENFQDEGPNTQQGFLREDVMRVNVHKPDQAHFSVVDIPGLVSGGSREDQKISEKLARDYIRNPRAIILAVMPAVDDIHNQTVLRLIKEENATDRTIGVVTKCDMLQPRDEPKTLELLRNQRPDNKLELGWFAVRNRTTQELEDRSSHRERDEKEMAFFNRRPWSSVNRNATGITNLMTCLSDTLYKTVKKYFPDIQREIRDKLRAARAELIVLGTPRDNERSQRSYLDDIQRRYEALARQWLSGTYRENCPANDPSKLRAHLNILEETFEKKLLAKGVEYEFIDNDEAFRVLEKLMESPATWEEDLTKMGGILGWILETWNSNRGDGLWYKPPPDLEERLWRNQVRSWDLYSREYFDESVQRIKECTYVLFHCACPEASVRRKIQQALDDLVEAAITRSEEELRTILNELGRLKTCSRRFMETLHTAQWQMSEMLGTIVDNKLRLIFTTQMNLQGFWTVALARFVDNVILQVVERHLLGPNGPIFAFSVDWVRYLPGDQLDTLVGEDMTVCNRREELQREIHDLNQILRDSERILHR